MLVPRIPLRRITALAAGYTLAAGPVRADAIVTATKGLDAGMTKVKVADGEMPAYYAKPSGATNPPIILVCMEIFGLLEWVKDVTRRLGHAGAFAVAPDYYFRAGTDLTQITEMPKLFPIVNAKKDTELFSDLDATVAWAKSQGGDANRLGIIGFCRGGRDTWLYAEHNPHLKAAVAWYGPVTGATSPIQPHTPLELAAELKCPLLELYGGKDESIQPEDVNAAAAKAKAEAIMAQRAAGGAPPSQPASSTSGTIASSAPSGSGAGETPPTTPSNQGGTPGGSGEGV